MMNLGMPRADLAGFSWVTRMEFDKSVERFPVKKKYVYMTHCGLSPLYGPAADREAEIVREHRDRGALLFAVAPYNEVLTELHEAAASLLGTSRDNLAFVKNTSEGMSMIAGGYPFRTGDRIVSYVHEYPANHYPWRHQERRGVELDLLQNRNITDASLGSKPCAWTLEDLEALVTDRTRVVAVSHVQFTSGFGADLKALGAFCRDRGIDLVVDAAQSLGALPLEPERWGISAVVSSGWKWLLGPMGTGLMYTSEPFREKLDHVMTGAELMIQGTDYLDHAWRPHRTAKRFEYSTSPVSLAAALATSVREVGVRYGPAALQEEIFRLQDAMLEVLDRDRFTPLVFPREHRSGILAVSCRDDPEALAKALLQEGVVCSARGGLLRLAPHFYLEADEVRAAVEKLNRLTV
ncbi:MAG: aminotransferase class V-fold PLP-dependent enzyme [Planctomycetota bacterium]